MKLVPLSQVFEIEYGNQLDHNKLDLSDDGINFVSRSRNNLGVVARVQKYKDTEPYPAGLITVSLGGTYLLSAFIQPEAFYTAQNIKVLRPKTDMSFEEKLFYCVVIGKNRFKYTSHGREANTTFNDILVPEEIPGEWADMDLAKLDNITNESVHDTEPKALDIDGWKTFNLTDLFKVTGTTTTPELELESFGDGRYPYVTTQATNNGVEGFYNYSTEKGGVLTVDSAVVGYCSYQPDDFSASDHVEKLVPNFEMNKYIALFLATVINKEQYRYNYGRKSSQQRLKKSSIKLPVDAYGKPNWLFMENYMKSLPYSSAV